MQDPRIRTGIAAVLSFAAFISLPGAALVFLWWLVFTPGLRLVKKFGRIFSLILMIAFFSLILQIYGGQGFSYFSRMTVIILIGMWVHSEQKSGDFLGMGVWLFGDRLGFEIGMIAEMGMQSLLSVTTDFDRIQLSHKIKGIRWGVNSLSSACLLLVSNAIIRAEDSAELLAVRGYHSGGTMCPEFLTLPRDIIAGIIALIILLVTLIPFSEFFILYR
jgi:energy-coupling factor transport system permease protein